MRKSNFGWILINLYNIVEVSIITTDLLVLHQIETTLNHLVLIKKIILVYVDPRV